MTLDTEQIYFPGDRIYIEASFVDAAADSLTDPSSVSFSLKNPGGTTSTFAYNQDDEVSRESTGVYVCAPIVNEIGLYQASVTAVGAIAKSQKTQFRVQPL